MNETKTTEEKPKNPQLPDEMQDCFILFKECGFGHGRLTAKNWIDNGCKTCEINRLKKGIQFVCYGDRVKLKYTNSHSDDVTIERDDD